MILRGEEISSPLTVEQVSAWFPAGSMWMSDPSSPGLANGNALLTHCGASNCLVLFGIVCPTVEGSPGTDAHKYLPRPGSALVRLLPAHPQQLLPSLPETQSCSMACLVSLQLWSISAGMGELDVLEVISAAAGWRQAFAWCAGACSQLLVFEVSLSVPFLP